MTAGWITAPAAEGGAAPRFSVIVAVFQGARTLRQCIDSVAGQTDPARELLVVDGDSRDGTVGILRESGDRITAWISEPDGGIYPAWNKALARARGEWILFLGADDFLWSADVLERAAQRLAGLPPAVKVAYGRIMLLRESGQPLYPVGDPWERTGPRFRAYSSIPHQAVFHRRALFDRHGRFDETFRIAGDYDLLLRELKDGDAAFMPDLIVTGMRLGGLSSTPANSLRTMREFRRSQRALGMRRPRAAWLAAMARIYVRLALWTLLGEGTARRLLDAGRRLLGKPPYWTRM